MITALNGPPAGRVAIVTGGSRGVGRATIGLLAARDYEVVVNYLHDQRGRVDRPSRPRGQRNAVAIRADIADDLDVQLFAETIAAFGGHRRRCPRRRPPDDSVWSNQGRP